MDQLPEGPPHDMIGGPGGGVSVDPWRPAVGALEIRSAGHANRERSQALALITQQDDARAAATRRIVQEKVCCLSYIRKRGVSAGGSLLHRAEGRVSRPSQGPPVTRIQAGHGRCSGWTWTPAPGVTEIVEVPTVLPDGTHR